MMDQVFNRVAQKVIEPAILASPYRSMDNLTRKYISSNLSRMAAVLPASLLFFAPTTCPMLTVAAVVMAAYAATDISRLATLFTAAKEKAKNQSTAQPTGLGSWQSSQFQKRRRASQATQQPAHSVEYYVESFMTDHQVKQRRLEKQGRGGVIDTLSTRLLNALGYDVIDKKEGSQQASTQRRSILEEGSPVKGIDRHRFTLATRSVVCLGAGAMAALCGAAAPISAVAAGVFSAYAAIGFAYECVRDRAQCGQDAWIKTCQEHRNARKPRSEDPERPKYSMTLEENLSMLEALAYPVTKCFTDCLFRLPQKPVKEDKNDQNALAKVELTRDVAPYFVHRVGVCLTAAVGGSLVLAHSPLLATAAAVTVSYSVAEVYFLSRIVQNHQATILNWDDNTNNFLLLRKDWEQHSTRAKLTKLCNQWLRCH